MIQYGKHKYGSRMHQHQCSICCPEQTSRQGRARARSEALKDAKFALRQNVQVFGRYSRIGDDPMLDETLGLADSWPEREA